MVISCPACSKKFEFKGEVNSRSRFRCTGCETVFSPKEGQGQGERAKQPVFKVLAATENNLIVEAVNKTLGDQRLAVKLVPDGNQVVESISMDKPHLIILDAAIQGLYSFSICETIKNDRSLKDIKIILTSAAFNKSRYKRRPTELFGADKYIEAHMLDSELALRTGELLGIELCVVPMTDKTDASPIEHASPENRLNQEQNSEKKDVDHQAKRLARVIAADILLYHRKKLSHKVEKQDAMALFSQEIEEAVKYYTKRLPNAEISYIYAAIEECLDSINHGGFAASF